MKQLISLAAIATSVAFAQPAAAEVTLNGYAFTGLYYEKNANARYGEKETQLFQRLQFGIKAEKKTDNGLTFFGSLLLRSETDNKHNSSTLNGAQVGLKYGPFTLAVGNVSDAIHSLKLFYDSQVGLCACGGNTLTVPYIKYDFYTGGANGILVTYNLGKFTANAAWESNGDSTAAKGEGSISVSYTGGPLKFELGYVHQSRYTGHGGYSGETFVTEYAQGKTTFGLAIGYNKSDAGLLNRDNLAKGQPGLDKTIATIYVIRKFNAMTLQAFYSQSTGIDTLSGEVRKTSYGAGGSYDLGPGASFVFGAHTDRTKDVIGDLGLKFSF